jgi:hypothetical protein
MRLKRRRIFKHGNATGRIRLDGGKRQIRRQPYPLARFLLDWI